jgi:hypothetical protein
MEDISREALEASRPTIDPTATISFCLDQLYRSRERRLKDPVTPDMALTFEELIGALLLARDEIMIQDYEH